MDCNLLECNVKAEFTLVFSVTWFFRNHSDWLPKKVISVTFDARLLNKSIIFSFTWCQTFELCKLLLLL